MKYTSKFSIDSNMNFQVDRSMLDWLDSYTMGLLYEASQTINANERDDLTLEARGSRNVFVKLMHHYNKDRKE